MANFTPDVSNSPTPTPRHASVARARRGLGIAVSFFNGSRVRGRSWSMHRSTVCISSMACGSAHHTPLWSIFLASEPTTKKFDTLRTGYGTSLQALCCYTSTATATTGILRDQSTQYVRFLLPKTLPLMAFLGPGTSNLRYLDPL